MTWKLYAAVSAGAFVATYLVSSPAKDVARSASSAAPVSARKAIAGSDIEQLADRLHVRLKAEESFRTPGRDLFRFQSKPESRPVVKAVPPAFVEAPAPAPAPVLPTLSLTGVATDMFDGAPRRAAVLSARGNAYRARHRVIRGQQPDDHALEVTLSDPTESVDQRVLCLDVVA